MGNPQIANINGCFVTELLPTFKQTWVFFLIMNELMYLYIK